MKPRHLLCLSALLLPGALPAAPMMVPCKLPAHGDWEMTNERQGWSRDGKPWTVTVTQSIRVDRDASGIRMTLGIMTAKGQLDAAARQRLATMVGPNGLQPISLRLAEDGRIVAIDDLDRHWKATLDVIEQVARDMEAAGQSSARARATLAALTHADEATRIGMVASNIGPFLQLCGQQVEGDAAGDVIIVTTDKDSPQLLESATYRIDAATGLAREIMRRVTVKVQLDRPQLDRWRFDAAPASAGKRP